MTKQQTSSDYFKTLSILYTALLAGQLLFAAIIFFVVSSGNFKSPAEALQPVLMYAVPLLLAAGVLGSNRLFKKKIKDIPATDNLSSKLNAYRAALILRYALVEFPCLFAIIAYFISGAVFCIVLAVVAMLLFMTLRPTKEKLCRDLDLSTNETTLLNDPAAVVTEFEVIS